MLTWQAALPLPRADGPCTAPGVSPEELLGQSWGLDSASSSREGLAAGLLPSALPAMPLGLGSEKQSIFARGEMKQSSHLVVIIFIGSD